MTDHHSRVAVQDQISEIVHAEDTDEHYDRYWSDRVAERIVEQLDLPPQHDDATRPASGDVAVPYPDVEVEDVDEWRYFRRGSAVVDVAHDGDPIEIASGSPGDPAGAEDLIACLQAARQFALAAASPSESGGQ
ncbi:MULTISPECIES: hypothetical protein [Mycobacteriaceae]|uniref:hypothetical protein n=1 Tax=Mycobacteriaceae TaxID=1762 RepID=UPI000268246D|nr:MULTISPECIES: hypothetical protein [Mycobacteriaceae]EIU51609.1 hypothetical protein MA6G0125S_5321 [Mycobacteroides abscessus 6G-0125-S]EIU64272.1 hypothetical protein MA6G0728S_5413 [Mycobacteroides abscessus 6G-0728-S]EIU74701.1 hypothetical protein MA6G1108_5325 [Mycobacteroides abscessus 6G-1108]EIV03136.1 hypothetical protein MA6G0728R_5440 [Mycobacteroides abscessus 6G-0728-R]